MQITCHITTSTKCQNWWSRVIIQSRVCHLLLHPCLWTTERWKLLLSHPTWHYHQWACVAESIPNRCFSAVATLLLHSSAFHVCSSVKVLSVCMFVLDLFSVQTPPHTSHFVLKPHALLYVPSHMLLLHLFDSICHNWLSGSFEPFSIIQLSFLITAAAAASLLVPTSSPSLSSSRSSHCVFARRRCLSTSRSARSAAACCL